MPCKASSNRPRPRWPASARKRPRPNPHGRPPWPPAPLPTNPPTCRPCCPHPNASAWSRCASNCRRHNSALPPCSKPHSASTRNCGQALTEGGEKSRPACKRWRNAATHSANNCGVRTQLADDQRRRQGQQALFERIAAQASDSELWQHLDGLIGSAKGDKYRRFAQGLTLDHLLHLANLHLSRLHGRYLLRRKPEGELELDIVDSWQGDTRATRARSGGEAFLVSLALALALSDLVSHKTSIDSLFLDEGFGTLDADTLEIALDALDRLNDSGKMIGIISHVEALKERIAVQVRVEKGGGVGHSRLVVSS